MPLICNSVYLFQAGRASAEKRNTWTSHSVLPPITSPQGGSSALSGSSRHSGSRGYSSSSLGGGGGNQSPFLPSEPITLDKAEEMELLRSLGVSLHHHKMDILKDIYNQLSSAYDQSLTGWVHVSDVSSTLQKCQVLVLGS